MLGERDERANRRPPAFGPLAQHVVDLALFDDAQLRGDAQDFVGLVGVDMELEELRRGGHQQRTAVGVETTLQRLGIETLTAHHHLGAVTLADRLLGMRHVMLEIGVQGRLVQLRDRLAAQRAFGAFEEIDETQSARVHHIRLAQHRELRRRSRQRRLACLEHRYQQVPEVAAMAPGLARAPADRLHDADDGALDRFIERLVHALGRRAQRFGHLLGAHSTHRAEGRGETKEPMREDETTVALCAEYRRLGGLLRRASKPGLGAVSQRARRRRERQRHVGSGVAIGNREDIDAVDILAGATHPVRARHDHAPEPAPVQIGNGHSRRPVSAAPSRAR